MCLELTLENFPVPEDYRAQLKQTQKEVQKIASMNKNNVDEIAEIYLPLVPTTLRADVEDWIRQQFGYIHYRKHMIYYYAKFFSIILKPLPANILPTPEYFFEEFNPEFFALLVRHGLYTIEDFKAQFTAHPEWNLDVLGSILMCLGPVLSREDAENLYRAIPDTNRQGTSQGPNRNRGLGQIYRFRRPFRSPRLMNSARSLRSAYSSEMENEEAQEEEYYLDSMGFLEHLENKFEKIDSILSLNCKADGVLTAIIADDLDWWIKNVDPHRVTFGKHEYYYLNRIFNICENSTFGSKAAAFSAHRIFTYMLENNYITLNSGIRELIRNQDLGTLKIVCHSTTLTAENFQEALKTGNIELIKFIYDRCLGKSHLCMYPTTLFDNTPVPPASILFIIQHIIGPDSLKAELFNSLDTSIPGVADFIALFMLYHGPCHTNGEDRGFSALFRAGYDDLVKEILKRHKSSIKWQKYIQTMDPPQNGQFVASVLETYGPFTTKQLAKLCFEAIQMMAEGPVIEIIRVGGAKVLEYEYGNLTILNTIIWREPINVITAAINTEGIDINYSKRPDLAAPLHFAAHRGEIAIVDALLAIPGIDINRLDGFNRTPLDCARNPAVIKSLFAHGGRVSPFERLDKFRERDFIGLSYSMHKLDPRGPLHIETKRSGNFGGFNSSWNPSFSNFGRSATASALIGGSRSGFALSGRVHFELGSNTRNLIAGPYGFGCSGATQRSYTGAGPMTLGGYGTIGRSKK